jgi:chromosome segregation ATPase
VRLAAITFLAVAVSASIARTAAAAERPLEAPEAAFGKWVEVQEAIARDQRDWTIEQEFLTEEIRLLKEEITALQEKTGRLDEETKQTEADLARLTGQNEEFKTAASRVESALPEFEQAVRALHGRFPLVLQETLEPLMGRLPKDGSATKASISERMQAVVGVMSQVDKFNGALTVVPELRTNPAGKEVQVRTLYLGLAQAWFVSLDGSFAGHGIPGATTWEWSPANEIAPEVKRAIDIQQGAGVAAYVSLPVKLK